MISLGMVVMFCGLMNVESGPGGRSTILYMISWNLEAQKDSILGFNDSADIL